MFSLVKSLQIIYYKRIKKIKIFFCKGSCMVEKINLFYVKYSRLLELENNKNQIYLQKTQDLVKKSLF